MLRLEVVSHCELDKALQKAEDFMKDKEVMSTSIACNPEEYDKYKVCILFVTYSLLPLDYFTIFKDRVHSLLERWDKPNLTAPEVRIKGCLAEINDLFTLALCTTPKPEPELKPEII